jgi:Uma2 family endonuclease
MSTAIAPEKTAPPPRKVGVENVLRLGYVSWDEYKQLRNVFRDRPVKITYDRGDLEIMVVSFEHESHKKLLARLLEALTVELDLAIRSLGNATFQMEDAERGLEPDECWYIANESAVRGKRSIDLTVDPPPDLALEVEVTRSALNRVGIYAAMGVRELWRYDGIRLRVFVLVNDRYEERPASPTFPTVPLTFFTDALSQFGKLDENAILKVFRQRVRGLS